MLIVSEGDGGYALEIVSEPAALKLKISHYILHSKVETYRNLNIHQTRFLSQDQNSALKAKGFFDLS